MNFFQRPPSNNWEPVNVPGAAGSFVWVWFRPPHNPLGFMLTIPPQCFASTPPQLLTIRNLAAGCGVPIEAVGPCLLYGQPLPGQPDHPQWMDASIPPTGSADATIQVQVVAPAGGPAMPQPLMMPMPQPMMNVAPQQPAMPMPASAPADANSDALLRRMDADWKSTLLLEKNAHTLRQQLSNIITKLGSLNRDLGPEERLYSDRLDQNDWQDARRWIRDAASKAGRFLKDFDVGMTSNAGRREWFDQLHKDNISQNRPFENMASASHEFETYRKSMQTLVANMQGALASATQDGAARAQRILTRIAAKVRKAKTNR